MKGTNVRRFLQRVLLWTIVAVQSAGCAMLWTGRSEVSTPTEQAAFTPRPDSLGLLKGTWTVHPAYNEADKQVWTFDGDRFRTKDTGGDFQEGTVSVNDRIRPTEVDIRIAAASDASLVGKTLRGIMRLRGDTVRFCIAEPQARRRPIFFDAAQGRLFVGERK